MNTPEPAPRSHDSVRTSVRDRYGRIVSAAAGCGGSAPAGSCSGSTSPVDATAHDLGYTRADIADAPTGSNLGLGCGNPVAIQSLRAGESVLDLGSGAGFDAFLAARAVGPTGRVIGVDMTWEMVQAARANLAKSGRTNVEFRLGEIESLPVADASIDVVLSNCVVNLSPEKQRVFDEAHRVLRPGGRLAISDIVALAPLSADQRADLELHAGCISGAASIAEVRAMLDRAGFVDVRIEPKAEVQPVVDGWFPGRGVAGKVASANITARKATGGS